MPIADRERGAPSVARRDRSISPGGGAARGSKCVEAWGERHAHRRRTPLAEELRSTTADRVDVGSFLGLDREFHLLTYSVVPFKPLSSMIDRLWNMILYSRRVYISHLEPTQFGNTHADHHIIAEASERRVAESAADATRIHIHRTLMALEQSPGIFDAG